MHVVHTTKMSNHNLSGHMSNEHLLVVMCTVCYGYLGYGHFSAGFTANAKEVVKRAEAVN